MEIDALRRRWLGGVDPGAVAELIARERAAAAIERDELRRRVDELAAELAQAVKERATLRKQLEESSSDAVVLRMAAEVAERTKREAEQEANALLSRAHGEATAFREDLSGLHLQVRAYAEELSQLVAKWGVVLDSAVPLPPLPVISAPPAPPASPPPPSAAPVASLPTEPEVVEPTEPKVVEPTEAEVGEPTEAEPEPQPVGAAPTPAEPSSVPQPAPEPLAAPTSGVGPTREIRVLVTPVTTAERIEQVRVELSHIPGVTSARLDRHETFEAEFVVEANDASLGAGEFAGLGTPVPSAPDRVLLLLPVEGP